MTGVLTDQQAGALLDQLQTLATDMVGDVGEHSSRIEEINQTLSKPQSGPIDRPAEEAVFAAISPGRRGQQSCMQNKLQSAEKQIRDQSRQIDHHLAEALRIDPLTKLANRRAFDLEIAPRFAERDRSENTFSLLLLDIDHFKAFNDACTAMRSATTCCGTCPRSWPRRCAKWIWSRAARWRGVRFVVLPMTDLANGKRARRASPRSDRPAARTALTDEHCR